MTFDDDSIALATCYTNYLSNAIVSKALKRLLDYAGTYPHSTLSERDVRPADWESLCELCSGK